ncbi:hypothetical protein CPB84DRAFT_1677056 [Gymnopilus junonius]|uniref:Uncharacterized protein n=1 Tax=Gymnopilus junonius TaxID=109634 RepID=A0A9P5NQ00_GYMJU|nr:hypothetical protein CPB84DRAFT_1677056 [Gymnopilus junonius]
MFSTLVTVALFIAPAIQGVFADFAINSPALVQCKPAEISWEATKGPYNLIVVKASDPCGDALVNVGDFNKTAISWTASIAAGTIVQLSLLDAEDNEAWSKAITVGSSSDSSCLHGASSAASSTHAATAPATTPTPPALSTPTDTNSAADTTPTDVAAPVGAANAGTNPFSSGAINARRASTPLLAVAGFAAVFALL